VVAQSMPLDMKQIAVARLCQFSGAIIHSHMRWTWETD